MWRWRLRFGVRKAAGEAEDEKVPFEAKERKVGREVRVVFRAEVRRERGVGRVVLVVVKGRVWVFRGVVGGKRAVWREGVERRAVV